MSADMTVLQCREDCDGCIQTRQDVRDGDSHLLRPAARQVIAFPGDTHQPSLTLENEVVSGALGGGSALPEAGD